MIKKEFLKFGAKVATLPVLFLPASVFAAANPLDAAGTSLTTIKTESGITGGAADLPTLIGRIIGAVIGITGIILVFYIIMAGIGYMTSQGDPGKVDKAKKQITSAVIGIIILVAAYSISNFVITTIKSATG